ncbi:hypothetical protein POTOM_049382 [Populus tomentosa]|uniref:Uncharacterized protein n=1 Tax=Populus tomentosa TaxID=118781 RepID=A0A8X8C391_POPTO|nr:hypothetical protein POTOM_049382 [Populus tomentosa]
MRCAVVRLKLTVLAFAPNRTVGNFLSLVQLHPCLVSALAVDGHRSLPSPIVISSSGIDTSTIREADGSPMANSSPPLHGFIVEDCSDDEELEEKQLDFTFSKE